MHAGRMELHCTSACGHAGDCAVWCMQRAEIIVNKEKHTSSAGNCTVQAWVYAGAGVHAKDLY